MYRPDEPARKEQAGCADGRCLWPRIGSAVLLGSPSDDTDAFLDNMNSIAQIEKFSIAAVGKQGNKLWLNDYWRRAWVFQELALARSIALVCGSRKSLSDDILTTIRRMEHDGTWTSVFERPTGKGKRRNARRFVNMFQVLYSFKPAWEATWTRGISDVGNPFEFATRGAQSTSLHILQTSRRHYLCSDPRDMLYSRMAVALDGPTLIPYADPVR